MRNNRGFFFLVGVVVTYLSVKLYLAGFWHQIGFMAANQVIETPLTYGSYGDRNDFSLLAIALDSVIDILVWIGTVAWLSLTGLLQIVVTIVKEALRGIMSLGGFVREATDEMQAAAKDRKEVVEVVAADKDFRTRVIETLQDDRAQLSELRQQLAELGLQINELSSSTHAALQELSQAASKSTTTRSRAKTTAK